MGMTIHKYLLIETDVQRVEMPVNGRIISVQIQGGKIYLWAVVDPNRPVERRCIFIYGTGNPLPSIAQRFIGTVQQGKFVWHIFEDERGN